MKRACLCLMLALLAGFSLHGQPQQIDVFDILGGSSFAPGSLAVLDTDFVNQLGTTVAVSVGGQNAYVISAAPAQYQIQIPVTAPTGANVLVTAFGVSTYILIAPYAPLLETQAGSSFVDAWHSNGSPVSPDAPAMPGETINVYAVGLGPTSPIIPTGGTGYGQTTTLPTVTLGGNQCKVLYGALGTAGVGVYQVYFNVPANAPSGNQQVSVSIGGVTSNALALTVGPNPAIAAVMNNYSFTLPGTANYGIAPGSIFTIFGSGMATPGVPAVLQDSTNGLPSTLNGASVEVTVLGVTVRPALYYATATQIAAVLPSITPVGTGTITVTYNGIASAPATIQVVESALGLATISGDGTGPVIATDANNNLNSPTNPITCGEIVSLWGSGLGADPAASDTTYSPTPHPISSSVVPLTFYLATLNPQVVWQGRSGYPGLDQINIQMPGTYQTNCYYALTNSCAAPLQAVSGTDFLSSNSVTLWTCPPSSH
ncbi:MAG: hypothetical protein WBL61_01220 [Bryobacteraceae bacterium]